MWWDWHFLSPKISSIYSMKVWSSAKFSPRNSPPLQLCNIFRRYWMFFWHVVELFCACMLNTSASRSSKFFRCSDTVKCTLSFSRLGRIARHGLCCIYRQPAVSSLGSKAANTVDTKHYRENSWQVRNLSLWWKVLGGMDFM
jgi:hypothetical protein